MQLMTIGNYSRLPLNSNASTQRWITADISQKWVIHHATVDDGIPVFEFKPLVEISVDLVEAGWNKEDTQSFITGLSELPEYADQRNDIGSREK